MRRTPIFVCGLSLVLAALPFGASDAETAGADPAARGLDVFLHAPAEAAPRTTLPLQIEAYGFPTASALVPLGAATVEAAWDPEKLGPGVSAAPPAVRTTTDASGRAKLEVTVPDGDERELALLVGVRSGAHQRTHTIAIKRGRLHAVALYVTDTHVVPGSSIAAWVTVANASTGAAAAGAPVELALVEGGLPRQTWKVATDAAGTAMARVPIPFADEPSGWELRARSLAAGDAANTGGMRVTGEGTVQLTPREETPASPSMQATFASDAVRAGDRAPFTVRVRDASDQPVAGLAVRYWVGPTGTEAPSKDAEWDRVAKRATTDALGEVHGTADAPSLVVKGAGTALRLIAKASVEGHALEQSSSTHVGAPTPTATLSPEAGVLVPGVEQRLLLRVLDGRDSPVAASFTLEGDGLMSAVTTNADGEGEFTWKPPVDVGALRNVGPCPGDVAASVIVRPIGSVPALATHTEPFQLCLRVDREAGALVSVDRPFVRAGDRAHVRLLAAPSAKPGPAPAYSVILRSPDRAIAKSVWIEDGEKGADIDLPSGARGAWTIEATSPSPARAAKLASGAILVVPRVLPKLAARVAGGRAAPGGAVDVDVDLTDGKGQGLTGTVAAVVVDLHGGGSVAGLTGLDTRKSICGEMQVDADRCDRFVEGDPALDALRRGVLGRAGEPLHPVNDPGGSAHAALVKTFGSVMRSLEGAVFEASSSPDRIADARRRGPRSATWNPELMTLVTAAMDTPPTTPGGEPLALADLMNVDAQVTYDNVAHRVARLKLFYLLAKLREARRERNLDPDEPALRDPNAFLRRLVRDGRVTDDMLLDPWGGTFQFVKASGPSEPFLTVTRGFELRAPGPDGRIGTADDVRDPFERVLRSKTPYAEAVNEDRLVDARFDMEVADATVDAWRTVLEELTGRQLGGRGEGIGLGGIGTSGGGGGLGLSGHGSRSSHGLALGAAWWSPPERTDARGHVRFHVPLGDAETTWRIAFVGVADGASKATTSVDVPVTIPLSARVDTGVSWIEGDALDVAITVRNHTAKPVRAVVAASASGAARLADGKPSAERAVDVPAGGATIARVPVTAPQEGRAELRVSVRAPDLPEDVVHHTWQVLPPGEPTDVTRAQWVERDGALEATLGERRLGDKDEVPHAARLVGSPRVVFERGIDKPLAAALEAVDPDRLSSPAAFADAIEVASRIERWATAKQGQASPTLARATEIARRARGRFAAYVRRGGGHGSAAVEARVHAWTPPDPHEPAKKPACPTGNEDENGRDGVLEAEPVPEAGVALACWDTAVTSAGAFIGAQDDVVMLARAFLALAERPHRAALATSLLERLRKLTEVRPSGAIKLPEAVAVDRASRAIVFAALLRGVRMGEPSAATADRLAAWIGVQRDADGGYGSTLATREVVRALVNGALDDKGNAHVIVTALGERREVDVPASSRVEMSLPPSTVRVGIEVEGPGVIARLERPIVRLWSRPPPAAESPLRLDVAWPSDARAGVKGVVSLSVRDVNARAGAITVRVPLPPGASLAEAMKDVRQVQGALLVRWTLPGSGVATPIEVPVRFGLTGRVTVPEAYATLSNDEAPRAIAPARALVIR